MPSLALRAEGPSRPPASPARAPLIALARQSRQNRLLRALPEEVWNRLSPHLELIELRQGAGLLQDVEGPADYVYFPTNSIVSLLCVTEDGAAVQTAMVGVEGMVGISLFMGRDMATGRALVQSPGYAFRLPARVLVPEFERTPAVTRLLLRHTQSLMVQMAQAAVCNRHHAIEQQLCRWLLSSLDRLVGNDLAMTQEFIATLIGVRREGVTEAAGRLQRLGLIRYSRGRITVVDREALEHRACECYGVVKGETERLLPPLPPPFSRAA